MAGHTEITNLALFCDFENVALGVRDANYAQFDILRVLERLLLKGSIVVKKAYCDWERFKEFKKTMHEASFELIEIPHLRMSGKNSADIRMVVDALDLCYTKSHVDAFVIISGDSDFSPLVSKLRENNKYVIGIGVRSSTSDLLAANCDEFIFYDDLVQAQKRKRRQPEKKPKAAAEAKPGKREDDKREKEKREEDKREEDKREDDERDEDKRESQEKLALEGLERMLETVEALQEERGDDKLWGSMVKQTMKRRFPGFSETALGYRTFRHMLEDAQKHKLLQLQRDEKSGQYMVRLPGGEE